MSPVNGQLLSQAQLPILPAGSLWLGEKQKNETSGIYEDVTSVFSLNDVYYSTAEASLDIPCILKLSLNKVDLLDPTTWYAEFAKALPSVDYLTVADEEAILAGLAIDIIGVVFGKSQQDPNKPPKRTIEIDVKFRGLPNNLLLTDEKSGKVFNFDENLNHNLIVGINNFAPNYDRGKTSTSLINNICIGVNSMLELGIFSDNNIIVGNNNLKTSYNSGLIGIGHEVFHNPILAKDCIAIGHKALNDFGGFNLGNILNPINLVSPGSGNIAIGHRSLENLPASGNNVAIGNDAMGNIAGQNFLSLILNNIADGIPIGTIENLLEGVGGSVAIGYKALQGSPGSISDGSIAIGHEALKNYDPWVGRMDFSDIVKHTDISLPCIGIGFKALNSTRSGSSNLAIGHYAAFNLNFDNVDPATAESRHIAIGDLALFKFSSKNFYETMRPNLAIGVEALGGGKALSKLTTFRGCVGIGDQSLFNCHTGQFCMGLGIYTNVSETDLINASAIGPYAEVASSHSMVFGGYSQSSLGTDIFYPNIGIGTKDPLYALHVNGTRKNNVGGIFMGVCSTPTLGNNFGALLYSSADIGSLLSGSHLYVETGAHGVMEVGAPLVMTGDVTGTGDASNNITTTFAPNPVFTGQGVTIPAGNTRPSSPLEGTIRFNSIH